MKRSTLSAAVALILIGGATAFYLKTRKPDPYAELKSLAGDFAASTDANERLEVAVRLNSSAAFQVALIQQRPANFSAPDREILLQAKRVADDAIAAVRRLEAGLTVADLRRITASNPDSILPGLGSFESSRRLNVCTEAEYARIRAAVPLPELRDRGVAIGAYVLLSEARFLSTYLRDLLDLVRADDRFVDYRAPAAAVYGLLIEQERRFQKLPPLTGQASGPEKTLREGGLSSEGLRAYVIRMARSFPLCFGHPSTDLSHWIRREVTKEKGEYFYGQLRDYVRAHRAIPEDVGALPVREGDPLLGDRYDGWLEDFHLLSEIQNPERVHFVSYGGDAIERTADDLDFGWVSVRETR